MNNMQDTTSAQAKPTPEVELHFVDRPNRWLVLIFVVLYVWLVSKAWSSAITQDWANLLLMLWLIAFPIIECMPSRLVLTPHHLQRKYRWRWLDKRRGWRVPLSDLSILGKLEAGEFDQTDPLKRLQLVLPTGERLVLGEWQAATPAGKVVGPKVWPPAKLTSDWYKQFKPGPIWSDELAADLSARAAQLPLAQGLAAVGMVLPPLANPLGMGWGKAGLKDMFSSWYQSPPDLASGGLAVVMTIAATWATWHVGWARWLAAPMHVWLTAAAVGGVMALVVQSPVVHGFAQPFQFAPKRRMLLRLFAWVSGAAIAALVMSLWVAWMY